MDRDAFHFLGDVFRTAGVPEVNYVEPHFLRLIRVNLATPASTLVVEGPSGIGKTTAVKAALDDLIERGGRDYLEHPPQWIRGTNDAEVNRLIATPAGELRGVIIVDDFHRIYPFNKRDDLSDRLKEFSDSDNSNAKFVVVGVRKANRYLLNRDRDVASRLDVVQALGVEDQDLRQMIEIGEKALNVKFSEDLKQPIVSSARGSFQLAQMMCFHACAMSGVVDTHRDDQPLNIDQDFDLLRKYVIEALDTSFKRDLRQFSKGQQKRFTFKAPYLRLLEWIRDHGPWEIDLSQAIRRHPEVGKNVRELLSRVNFREWCGTMPTIRDQLYFDTVSYEVFVENPAIAFYLGEHTPHEFRRKMGLDFQISDRSYQVAISYASENRDQANALYQELRRRDIETFFDQETVDGLVGQVLIDKIRSIYGQEADVIVPIISKDYQEKFWTHLEETTWKPLIDEGRVYPVFVGSPVGEYGVKLPGRVIAESASEEAWVERSAEQIEALLSKLSQD